MPTYPLMMLPFDFFFTPTVPNKNNATGPSSTVSYTQQCRSRPHILLPFIRKSFENDLHKETEQRMRIQRSYAVAITSYSAADPHAAPFQQRKPRLEASAARALRLRPTCLPSPSPTSGRCTGTRGEARARPAGAGIGPTRRCRSLAATSHKGCVPPSPRALRLGPQHAATPTTRSVVLRLSPAMGSGRAAAAENGGRRCAPARPCRPTRCDQRREPFPGLGSGPPA